MKAALIVGCSSYDDPAIANVSFANNDALGIAGVLKGTCGFEDDNLNVLTSADLDFRRRPTRNNLITALTRFRKDAPPPEKLEQFVLFFSGHGFHSTNDENDYLIPQDGVSTSLEDSCLSVQTIVRFLRGWAPKVTVLMLDVCRANIGNSKGLEPLSPIDVRSASHHGFVTFWSCSPGERSFEVSEGERGVFTLAICKALSDVGRCATIYELDTFLSKAVPQICLTSGLPKQTPYTQIEPMDLRNGLLVSQVVLATWQGATQIGEEIRRRKVPRVEIPHLDFKTLLCGIDFGTTHSALTISDINGRVHFVPSLDGKKLVPSVVAVTETFDFLVGWPAIEYSYTQPENTVFHLKRFFGTSENLHVSGRSFAPEFLASLIIRSLSVNLEEWLGVRLEEAVISAPVNFTLQQCHLLRQAFHLAGIRIRRLISEPNAAAVALAEMMPDGKEKSADKDELLLVIDLGGGTLDVSIIDYGQGVFEILGTSGDTLLGGMDYDAALCAEAVRIIEGKLGCALSLADRYSLTREAERAKIELGVRAESVLMLRDLEVDGNIRLEEITVTRERFAAITSGLNARVEGCIDDALARTGYNEPSFALWRGTLDAIVIAGQAAKLFTIQEILARRFPGVRIVTKYAENAVVLGLAKYSDVFKGRARDRLLLDAMPTAIGLRCKELYEKARPEEFGLSPDPEENRRIVELLPRDTTIPTKKSTLGKLSRPSNSVTIALVEMVRGHGGIVSNDLGSVTATIPAGAMQVMFEVDVDADRTVILNVKTGDGSFVATIFLNNFVYESAVQHGQKYQLEARTQKPV